MWDYSERSLNLRGIVTGPSAPAPDPSSPFRVKSSRSGPTGTLPRFGISSVSCFGTTVTVVDVAMEGGGAGRQGAQVDVGAFLPHPLRGAKDLLDPRVLVRARCPADAVSHDEVEEAEVAERREAGGDRRGHRLVEGA